MTLTDTPASLLEREHVDEFGEPHTVETIFTKGDCWRLSLTLSDLLGVPQAFFCAGDKPVEPYDVGWVPGSKFGTYRVSNHWVHAAVRIGDDAFLDVNGVHTAADLLLTYAGHFEGSGWIFQDAEQEHHLTRGMDPRFHLDDNDVMQVAQELCSLFSLKTSRP